MKKILYTVTTLLLSILLLCSCDLSSILPNGQGGANNNDSVDNTCPHIDTYFEITEPSCTRKGYKVKLCRDCDEFRETEILNPTGHDYVLHERVEPTCTEAGNGEYYTCSRCTYSSYIELSATGHDFKVWVTESEPTCDEDGARYAECEICGEKSDPEIIPELGHVFGAWCDIAASGGLLQMRECKKCGDTVERETPSVIYTPSGEILAVKGGADSIVVLIHDDGYTSSIAAMDYMLEKYGLVGDAALLVDYVVEGGIMSRPRPAFDAFKHYMSNGRWSVINHSLTHRYWGDESTLTVNAQTMANEVIKSGEILREIFPNQRVLTFAYPGISKLGNVHGYDKVYKEIRELVSQHYVAGRGFFSSGYDEIGAISWDYTQCATMSDSSIDTILRNLDGAKGNNRLYVYLAHGIDDGPNHNITRENLEKICQKVSALVEEGAVWSAHYEEAALYLREAESAVMTISGDSSEIRVTLEDSLDDEIYNFPLTLRINVPDTYPAVRVVQGERVSYAVAYEKGGAWVCDIDVLPNGEEAVITKIAEEDIPEDEDAHREEEFEDKAGDYDFESSLDGVETVGNYLTASLKSLGKNKTSSLYLVKSVGAGALSLYPELRLEPTSPDALSLRFSVLLEESGASVTSTIMTLSLDGISPLLSLERGADGFYLAFIDEANPVRLTEDIPLNEWHKIKLLIDNESADRACAELMLDGTTVFSGELPEGISLSVTGVFVNADETSTFGLYLDNVALKTASAEEIFSDMEKYEIDLNYFKGFTRKAVTFTMDDGLMQYDEKFLKIVRPAGILGTFNLYNVNLEKADEYRELYKGYGIANHCNYHANVFADGKEYNITDEPWPGADTADKTKVYRHPTVEGLYYHFVTGYSWHPIADTEHYLEFAMQTEREIEEIFGEGVVKGFAYPNGNQNNARVISYLRAHGYTNIRRTYPLAGDDFSMPETRYSWSYNAMHNDLLSMMKKFEALADDGELKMFTFGVHPKDFETNSKWEDLYIFAATYGYRPDDYFYGTVDDIFAQEDAIKAITVEDGKIYNNSRCEIYVKVCGEKITIAPRTSYELETGVMAEI